MCFNYTDNSTIYHSFLSRQPLAKSQNMSQRQLAIVFMTLIEYLISQIRALQTGFGI